MGCGRSPTPSPAWFPTRPAGAAPAQAPEPTLEQALFSHPHRNQRKVFQGKAGEEVANRSRLVCSSAPSRSRRQPNAAPGRGAQPGGCLQWGARRGPHQPDLRVRRRPMRRQVYGLQCPPPRGGTPDGARATPGPLILKSPLPRTTCSPGPWSVGSVGNRGALQDPVAVRRALTQMTSRWPECGHSYLRGCEHFPGTTRRRPCGQEAGVPRMPEGPGAVLASQPPLWSSLGEEPVGVAALYPARHRGQVSPGRSGFSRAAPPKSLVWGVGCRWAVR